MAWETEYCRSDVLVFVLLDIPYFKNGPSNRDGTWVVGHDGEVTSSKQSGSVDYLLYFACDVSYFRNGLSYWDETLFWLLVAAGVGSCRSVGFKTFRRFPVAFCFSYPIPYIRNRTSYRDGDLVVGSDKRVEILEECQFLCLLRLRWLTSTLSHLGCLVNVTLLASRV